MTLIRTKFLEAFQAFLENRTVEWDDELSAEQWKELFHLAETHKALPIIFQSIYKSPSLSVDKLEIFQEVKHKVQRQVSSQMMKTQELLNLYKHLQKSGIHVLAVKGIICRSLYPHPDYRSSGDEDLLILREQFDDCHQAMLDYGMVVSDCDESDDEKLAQKLSANVVSYGKKGNMIYVEIHKSLFDPEADDCGIFNQFFEKFTEDEVTIPIQGIDVTTLNYTDNLFYLICHAFKHFIHSGFGIRQACDIVLFANKYGNQIDWEAVLEKCKMIHAELFAAALFKIGERYLTFSPKKAKYPEKWREIKVDEEALLEDLLSSGIHGGSDISHKYSGNLTKTRVVARKQGKMKSALIEVLFMPLDRMKINYTYLNRYPVLLPIAWFQRLCKYINKCFRTKTMSPFRSIRIANQRVRVLEQYGIIKED